MKLALTLACGEYDRTYPLRDGSVVPEGIDLNYVSIPPADLFRRQARHAEFDIAEFSLSTLMILHSRGDDRFVAIPIFPLRCFRHSFIFVRRRSGIRHPKDLVGKRVGSAEYQQTAALWIRAILQHDYGVKLEELLWYFGGLNTPDYSERIPLELPANLNVNVIAADQTLDSLLREGQLDALITSGLPVSFARGARHIRRLFPDYRRVEAAYFRRTGFFPIMHTVVIRRDIYEKARWIAPTLAKAFERAKEIALTRLTYYGALYCTVPWLMDDLEQTQQIMGDDFWSYGFARNRRILEATAQYSYEQGLINRPIDVADLFAPETRD